jgi:hypothetical protein
MVFLIYQWQNLNFTFQLEKNQKVKIKNKLPFELERLDTYLIYY